MTPRKHAVLAAATTLVLSALFVARAPARQSVARIGHEGHERSVRAVLEDAVMCVEAPATPPPCATPKSAAR